MPSIDLDTINFETGSWEIPPDQAAKLQAIADGLNRVISQNPRAVFLIEGHTDAVGSDVDNLSLSDRRAEVRGRIADAAIQRAGGKPDLARLRRAVPEDRHPGTGAAEPPRHHPQHRAAAQRRQQAAAPAARHRAAAEVGTRRECPGAIPAIRHRASQNGTVPDAGVRYGPGMQRSRRKSWLHPGHDNRAVQLLSLSSLGMCEPSPADSKPVLA